MIQINSKIKHLSIYCEETLIHNCGIMHHYIKFPQYQYISTLKNEYDNFYIALINKKQQYLKDSAHDGHKPSRATER